MRYIFLLILVLLVALSGCTKNEEEYSDKTGQGEYTSSACSSSIEETTHKKTEILTDAESGFGEIYIID